MIRATSLPARSRRGGYELVALGMVLAVAIGLPLGIVAYRSWQVSRAPARVIELVGRLPTSAHGGWTPETITVQKGEPIRLRITSRDVVHGFSISKLGIETGWIEPGKVTEVDFVADRPGRYAFHCTVWCKTGHWRMRGLLEVVDPADPAAVLEDVDPPQTDWMSAGLDIDADHPGTHVPATRPSAANGAALWQSITDRPIRELLADADPRLLTPSDAYALLTTGVPGAPSAPRTADLPPAERWDIVAALWFSRTTPESRRLGQRLFEQECTGCHGLAGPGDGPGAAAINAAADQPDGMAPDDMTPHGGMAKPVADFTDLEAQAGASDLHYYGKLVRGGMGTSMPYWATIFDEDELWALVSWLRGFAFHYPAPPAPSDPVPLGRPF